MKQEETGLMLSVSLRICRGRLTHFWSEVEVRASVWLICFSDLQVEPQYLSLGFYYSYYTWEQALCPEQKVNQPRQQKHKPDPRTASLHSGGTTRTNAMKLNSLALWTRGLSDECLMLALFIKSNPFRGILDNGAYHLVISQEQWPMYRGPPLYKVLEANRIL